MRNNYDLTNLYTLKIKIVRFKISHNRTGDALRSEDADLNITRDEEEEG